MEKGIPLSMLPRLNIEENDWQSVLKNEQLALINNQVVDFFECYFNHKRILYTNSCSVSLELALKVLGVTLEDEVIIPAFGFVAVANAVVNSGARPVLADVCLETGNIEPDSILQNISKRTKAVIGIHYAGRAFEIERILSICKQFNLYLIEDAAQAIGVKYKGKPLGCFGHLACMSFDYMKNVSCSQGGLLMLNEDCFFEKAQYLYHNGTNLHELKKQSSAVFDWKVAGGNYQINPIATHFLLFQINQLEKIKASRLKSWQLYYELLKPFEQRGLLQLPCFEGEHNAHIFYIILPSIEWRNELKEFLKACNISAEQHYSLLSETSFGRQFFDKKKQFKNAMVYCEQLLRLPLWNEITTDQVTEVANSVSVFFNTVLK